MKQHFKRIFMRFAVMPLLISAAYPEEIHEAHTGQTLEKIIVIKKEVRPDDWRERLALYWRPARPAAGQLVSAAGQVAMLHVILYQPEIPPNTGNVIRLCANTGASLHLVGPLGFQLSDSRLKRAGLDYAALASCSQYVNWDDFKARNADMRLWAFTTKGARVHSEACYKAGDGLLFGPETRGLPDSILKQASAGHCLRLPMADCSRSLNLSNTVAVGLYEAWRQLGYPGGA